MTFSRNTGQLVLVMTALGCLMGLWHKSGIIHSSDVDVGSTSVKTLITRGNAVLIYCDQNSKHPSCCNPEQCKLVQKSTVYSECCHNVPTAVTTHYGDHPPGNRHQRRIQSFPRSQKYLARKPTKREWMRPLTRAKMFPILITATPRSGTVFVQRLLRGLGLDVTNDSNTPRTDGMVSWMHIVNDNGYFGPVKLMGSKFRAVWHQVRDPLKGLTSMAFTEPLEEGSTKSSAYLRFLQRHIQLTKKEILVTEMRQQNMQLLQQTNNQTVIDAAIEEQFLIYRGMEFYTQWQRFIMALQIPRLHLEDLTESLNLTVLDSIFASAGKKKPPNQGLAKRLIEKGRRRRYLQESNHPMHTNHREHWTGKNYVMSAYR
jgi:hypothetical protein